MRLQLELLQRVLALVLIAAAASWVYVPYLQNPLVFDDVNIFYTDVLTTAAIAPWEIGIRGMPYFTLGWVETQIGSMTAHRLISLALHIAVAYQLFRFIETLLVQGRKPTLAGNQAGSDHARWIALLIALAFACHPAAVYGAGYLVQRTIVFAMLFSLLCFRCLLDALVRNDWRPAAWAAVWGSLSILSKQHAVLVPVAALALVTVVVERPWREKLKIAGLFLVLSLPLMGYALYENRGTVGEVYEPAIRELESELYGLPVFTSRYEKWLLSASTQAQLYFSYALQWLWPDTHLMSADLRVDFRRPWTHAGAWLWISSYVALPVAATLLAMRLQKGRLLALALTMAAALFPVEMASVRFQEPYVLYRSYLWATGYGLLAAVLMYHLPKKAGLSALALALPLLMLQASDRLDSFGSRRAIWEDAAAKLPKLEIAGSSRILFNRGGERFKAGKTDEAMRDINNAIRLNPTNGRYRIARAAAMIRLGRPQDALAELETASVLLPEDGHLMFVQFLALRALGRTADADIKLADAARHGHYAAKYEIARRFSTDGNVRVLPTERP